MTDSPFLLIPPEDWIASNSEAFAIFDRFPVSVGHALVITRRLVATWFDATPVQQSAVMQLVNTLKQKLDATLQPKPDGYNVGFNSGDAAGQTVNHLHVHGIPRYRGDVEDPHGGVRFVIPDKANYLSRQSPAQRVSPMSGQGIALDHAPPKIPSQPKRGGPNLRATARPGSNVRTTAPGQWP